MLMREYRIYRYLQKHKCDINSFLVFNRDDNPLNLLGKEVKSVDDIKNTLRCVIVSIGYKSIRSVSLLLERYNVETLLFITPQLLSKLSTIVSVSRESIIAEGISLENHVQIISDDTSVINIGEGCCFDAGVRIIATNNSIINIKANVIVDEKP